MRFTSEQRAKYVPDPCPACGGTVEQGWCNATTVQDLSTVGHVWVLGRFECRTPGCTYGRPIEDPLPPVDLADMIALTSRLGFDPARTRSILITSQQVNVTSHVLSETGAVTLGEDGKVRTELSIRHIR